MICFGWFQILTNMKMYDQINFGYLSIYLKFFLRKYHVHKYKTHHVGSQKPYFSCNNHLHLEYSSIGKTETDGNKLLSSSSSGSRNSGSIWIWSSNPGTVFKMKIQIQHSWIFHFPGFKIFWIEVFLDSHFLEWIFHWRKFESRKISFQKSFNPGKSQFRKMWIQGSLKSKKISIQENEKFKNVGFESGFWALKLDLNLKFRLTLSFDCLNLMNSGVHCHLFSFWLYLMSPHFCRCLSCIYVVCTPLLVSFHV